MTTSSRMMVRMVFMLAMALALTGCEVRQPGRVATAFVQGFKRTISVGGKKDVNPLPGNAENIRAGQENFKHYCLVCHGPDGQNTDVPLCRSHVSARASADLSRQCSATRTVN
jgi:mono/diheme cytochrome c family protein